MSEKRGTKKPRKPVPETAAKASLAEYLAPIGDVKPEPRTYYMSAGKPWGSHQRWCSLDLDHTGPCISKNIPMSDEMNAQFPAQPVAGSSWTPDMVDAMNYSIGYNPGKPSGSRTGRWTAERVADLSRENRCLSLTRGMIKWLFSLAFPPPSVWLGRQAFEGWVSTDQDEGYWQCRFCNAQKENGWKHEGSCKYAAVKRYLE